MSHFRFRFDRASRRLRCRQEAIRPPHAEYRTDETEVALPLDGRPACLLFFGYAIVGDAILFTREEAQERLAREGLDRFLLSEGSFVAVLWVDGTLVFANDLMGNTPLFAADPGDAIHVATTLLGLVETLREEGQPLRLDGEVCRRFLLRTMPTDQLFCARTPVQGVTYLDWLSVLTVHAASGASKEVTRRVDGVVAPPADYADAVARLARTLLRRIEAASRLAGNVVVTLSGGLDSRITYAAAKRLPLPNLLVHTGKAEPDARIARALADLHGDALNRKEGGRGMVPIALGTAFRRWELSNLGFYCLFEFQKLHPTSPLGSIEIRGGGGGILKSVFPFLRSPLDMAGLDYPSALVGRLEREQRHFIAYRNRIHCGRIHGGSETVLWRWDPLTSLDAVLAANLAPRTMRARGQVHCDLLLLLGPHLADVEFDKPHKAFTPAMREASPFRQARPSLDIEPLALGTLAGSGLADPWQGPKPPQPWVPSEEFAARAREHLRAVCRDALPAVPALAGLLPVAERFAEGPAPADLRNHARGVTKVYTLARLAQLGVEADPGAPRLRPDTPARRLLREASLRSRATLRRVLAGHGRG